MLKSIMCSSTFVFFKKWLDIIIKTRLKLTFRIMQFQVLYVLANSCPYQTNVQID